MDNEIIVKIEESISFDKNILLCAQVITGLVDIM